MTRASKARCRLRDELLVHPYELPLMVAVLVLAIVMSEWVAPDLLNHTAISFETRGVVHHLWHVALGLGAALNIAGRVVPRPSLSLWMQFAGLALLETCLAWNLTALIAGELDGTGTEPLGGLDVTARVALMIGIGVRLYIIGTRATVELGAGHA